MNETTHIKIIGDLEKEIADNERWMREVLTDFKIQFDDHKIGRRIAFTQWMFERQTSNDSSSTMTRANKTQLT